ncbi:MAG: fibronectin type III domain-containing protein, partial [Bacteroidales bacterium]|nr:fibronectin type III domain-containing protein [Bacteroidales bacterium]
SFIVGYACECDTAWSDAVSTVIVKECNAPVILAPVTVTTSSATVTWTGPALVVGYNVQIRVLDSATATPSAWITEFANENTCVIQLAQGKIYEYRVQSKCGSGDGDTSDWSAIAQVTALPITCFAPDNIAVVPSYYSAAVSWSNNGANSYEYAFRQGTVGNWSVEVSVQDTTAVIGNLSAQASYQVRVRSICGSETSAWSDPVVFTTTTVPACPLATNLQVAAITETSATISWTAPADHEKFLAVYRDVNADTWINAGDTNAETSRSLTNLTQNTAYTWRVMNFCDNGRRSNWANADNFKTLLETAVADLHSASTLKVYVSGKQINVLNPNDEYIESVAITSVSGKVLQNYTVRGRDNVLITTSLRNQIVVITVNGKNGVIKNEKVLIK